MVHMFRNNTMAIDWWAYTSIDVVHRRAGGRRGYNARRSFQRLLRRRRVFELLVERFGVEGLFGHHGACAAVARELGVSRATICRDRQYLLTEARTGWFAGR